MMSTCSHTLNITCSDSSSAESESAVGGTPQAPVASPIGQSPGPMETNEEGEPKTVERLFGEGLDLSSS